jgi:catechol 2,3-dioxygenase-like lactoylglutathione lyase family enzyme
LHFARLEASILSASGRHWLERLMIDGAHVIINSTDAASDRAFLRDVIGFKGVDAGGGWLIFALPPAELAVHPAEENGGHALYLMCDDVEAEIRRLTALGVACDPIAEAGWGRLTAFLLPGGGKLALYQPRHGRP